MSARATKGTTKPPPIPPARDSQEKTSIYDSAQRKKPAEPAQQLVQAISMKTPGQRVPADAMRAEPEPALKRPKLRAMSEVTPAENQQLGYFAPPVDPRHLRRRRTRDLTLVLSLSIIVASVIALVIWFAAR
ncbi:MAG TPA: hypothetical protein VGF94_05555 [Kofleriaceae bacterium]|jgi:hypothetical protein